MVTVGASGGGGGFEDVNVDVMGILEGEGVDADGRYPYPALGC